MFYLNSIDDDREINEKDIISTMKTAIDERYSNPLLLFSGSNAKMNKESEYLYFIKKYFKRLRNTTTE